MNETHPGEIVANPRSERDQLERIAAWTFEQMHFSHAAYEQAQRDHKRALAALEAFEGASK